ncbi:MAG TPA: 3-hydroxyacyl-CoA dehydrogenase NAD-binding domain-containing protein, partial [Candidatus Cybelea sp.]|nr:3-hydroxyacyl-CoA dehydrogenase NAD-binding domain-containing protein [Candidatus Cybelea sp.]
MDERCLIVGGGTMGSGIALVAARGGYGVEIVEPLVAARERALAYFEKETERSGDAGVVERIAWIEAIPQSSDAVLAIEAVPERFDLKRDVFVALERAIAPDALLATNTSSLSVSALADVVGHSDRVVGLHFFNP